MDRQSSNIIEDDTCQSCIVCTLVRHHPDPSPRMHSIMQASFEEQKDNGGFEQQYKKLCGDISGIYENAKEFHGKVRSSLSHAGIILHSFMHVHMHFVPLVNIIFTL